MRLLPLSLLFACAPAPDEPPDTGEPDPCPVLALLTDEVEVADAPVDVRTTATFEVRNDCDGARDLVVDLQLTGDAAFWLYDDSMTVAPGESHVHEVRFTAPDDALRTAEITLLPHGLEPVVLPLSGWGSGVDETVATGDLLITEVMPDPTAAAHRYGQWLEVWNRTDRPVDLYGWTLSSTSGAVTVDRALEVPAGGRVVLGAEADPSLNGGVAVDWAWPADGLVLEPLDDDLELAVAGLPVAWAGWTVEWETAAGASWQLDPSIEDVTALSARSSWCVSTVGMASGDRGTPGAENEACEGAADADGDGWTVYDGDCDDTAADVHPDAPEVWGNGRDDDCNDLSDDVPVESITDAWVDGDGSPGDRLGYRGGLGSADLDGDGAVELLVGGWAMASWQGGVHLLHGPDWRAWQGEAAPIADATFIGDGTHGAIGSTLGDVTGNGVPDLVVAGVTQREKSFCALAVFEGGTGIAGSLDWDAAAAWVTEEGVAYANPAVHSGLDLDGDGLSEVVYGEGFSWSDTGGLSHHQGRISIFAFGSIVGATSLADADRRLNGDAGWDTFGATVGGGDLDGDGYDDLLVGAPGDPSGGLEAGALYGYLGLPTSGAGKDRRDFAILGRTDDEVAEIAEPQVADVDGNGRADLVFSATGSEQVAIFLDAALEGTSWIDDADILLQNVERPWDFGTGLAVGDLDGDGMADLAIGAPEFASYAPDTGVQKEGRVYVVFGSDLTSGAFAVGSVARHVPMGMDPSHGFGQSLLIADLDGDARGELVAAAHYAADQAGRVYLIAVP